jgi:hypothetical protein
MHGTRQYDEATCANEILATRSGRQAIEDSSGFLPRALPGLQRCIASRPTAERAAFANMCL